MMDQVSQALEKYKDDPVVYNNIIPLAVSLCQAKPEYSSKINGNEILGELVKICRDLMAKGIDNDVIRKKLISNVKCLGSFAVTPEYASRLVELGFVEIVNTLKSEFKKKITKNLHKTPQVIEPKMQSLKEDQSLLTEGEVEKIKNETTMIHEIMNIIPLLAKVTDVDQMQEDCYPLALYMTESPQTLIKSLQVLYQLLEKDDSKEKVLMNPTDCMKAMLGLKNKYSKAEDVVAAVDDVLQRFDSTYMIDQTIEALKNVKNEDLEKKRQDQISILNQLKNIVIEDRTTEDHLLKKVQTVVDAFNELLDQHEKDPENGKDVLDTITGLINSMSAKGPIIASKLKEFGLEDRLVKALFGGKKDETKDESELASDYLSALAKVIDDKVEAPPVKKETKIDLLKNSMFSKKEEAPVDTKPTIWNSD